MIRVVTVIGHGQSKYGANFLPHFVDHYTFADEIDIVIYVSSLAPNIEEEIRSQVEGIRQIKIVKVYTGRIFDWNKVTDLYNEVKSTYPNDWWIVADIDEFHVYPYNDPHIVIRGCDSHGWDLVRGGFIDRVGENGTFPVLDGNKSVFRQFPMAGFFRYPMSKACPNKVCMMKGYVEITSGQHYAKFDGHTTWRWQGWNHPLIAPYDEYSVQVHHFKWDSSCIERIKAVADVNEEYAYSEEYRIMYEALKSNNFRVDITNPDFMFQYMYDSGKYNEYKNWDKLINKIVSI